MAYSGEFRTSMLEETSSFESSFKDSKDLLSSTIGEHIDKFRHIHEELECTVHLLYSCRKLVEDIVYLIIKEVGDVSDDFAKNIEMISKLNVFGTRTDNVVALVDSIRKIGDVFNHRLTYPEELDYKLCGYITLSFLEIVSDSNSIFFHKKPKSTDWKCIDCKFNNSSKHLSCMVCRTYRN